MGKKIFVFCDDDGLIKEWGAFSTLEKAKKFYEVKGQYAEIQELELNIHDKFLASLPENCRLFMVQIYKTGKMKCILISEQYEEKRDIFVSGNTFLSRGKTEKQYCQIFLTAKDIVSAEEKCIAFRDELVKNNTWVDIWKEKSE